MEENSSIFEDNLFTKYPEKRFVFLGYWYEHAVEDWFSEKTIKALITINKYVETNDIAIMMDCDLTKIKPWVNAFEEYCPKVKYFFKTPITTWAKLKGVVKDFNVCSLVIAEELAFDMVKVSQFAKENNKEIRVWANVLQSSYFGAPVHQKFFIRPEAVPLYEPLVDVLMFWNEISQKTVIDVYKNDKKWFGPLGEIIHGIPLESGIDGRTLEIMFDKMRVNCACKCVTGRECHICEALMNLSNTFKEQELYIRKEPDNGSKRHSSEEPVNSDDSSDNS